MASTHIRRAQNLGFTSPASAMHRATRWWQARAATSTATDSSPGWWSPRNDLARMSLALIEDAGADSRKRDLSWLGLLRISAVRNFDQELRRAALLAW